MDSKGHWHDGDAGRFRKDFRAIPDAHPNDGMLPVMERPVIEIGIGETVWVLKADGGKVAATFDRAEKNRVTLTPLEGGGSPLYLQLAENVHLTRSNGEHVRAQVWDNRGGKIVLRTLPL